MGMAFPVADMAFHARYPIANRVSTVYVDTLMHPSGQHKMLKMTPAQCRAARALLNWTQPQLASQAGLGLSTVVDFEKERRSVSNEAVAAIRSAFERASIGFVKSAEGSIGVVLQIASGGAENDESCLNNLHKPRPINWNRSILYKYIEKCWSNFIAFVAQDIENNSSNINLIDSIFYDLVKLICSNEENDNRFSASRAPVFLAISGLSYFRASVQIAGSCGYDAYPLMRACLESAGYCAYAISSPEIAKIWDKRDDSDVSKKLARNTFTNGNIINCITQIDKVLAREYSELYENLIDLGAHPSRKGFSFRVKGHNDDYVKVGLLSRGDDIGMVEAAASCLWVGFLSVRIYGQIFPNEFAAIGGSDRIDLKFNPS